MNNEIVAHIENRRKINAAQTSVIDFRHELSNTFTSERAGIQTVITEQPLVAAYIEKLERRIIESECKILLDTLLVPQPKFEKFDKVKDTIKEYTAVTTVSIENLIRDIDVIVDSLNTLRVNSVQLVDAVNNTC